MLGLNSIVNLIWIFMNKVKCVSVREMNKKKQSTICLQNIYCILEIITLVNYSINNSQFKVIRITYNYGRL